MEIKKKRNRKWNPYRAFCVRVSSVCAKWLTNCGRTTVQVEIQSTTDLYIGSVSLQSCEFIHTHIAQRRRRRANVIHIAPLHSVLSTTMPTHYTDTLRRAEAHDDINERSEAIRYIGYPTMAMLSLSLTQRTPIHSLARNEKRNQHSIQCGIAPLFNSDGSHICRVCLLLLLRLLRFLAKKKQQQIDECDYILLLVLFHWARSRRIDTAVTRK